MPWRDAVSPYRTWVSEIMLQQTQVDVVRGYFRRFMDAFPTVHALAAAEESQVLQMWAGLGYYSRARNLHKAARQMVALHGGEPALAMDWAELPGIGRYTLGAIRSIAYQERLPVVDGNVLRVLARYYGLAVRRGDPKDEVRVWALAERLVPAERPGDFNQALMELGATVCSPESPKCLVCPLKECQRMTQYPLPKKPAARKSVTLEVAWVERAGQVLMVERPRPGLWAGMRTLPAATDVSELLREIGALTVSRGDLLSAAQRALTHRDVSLSLHRYDVTGELRGEWVAAADVWRSMPSAFRALVA